jgi:nicotinate-nucleotide adenylyltransferase
MDMPGLDLRRLAFFGGTFDPPHRGHLAIARAAQRALKLDAVLFAPVGAQPLKPQGSTASFEDRVAMTRLALAGDPTFLVSLADAPSPTRAPNYTVDTLAAIRADLPFDAELYCLMGADSFLGLRRWHRGTEIPFVAPLIVASRPGQSLDDLAAILPAGLTISANVESPSDAANDQLRIYTLRNTTGVTTPLYLLPELHIEINASAIRTQIRSDVSASQSQNQSLSSGIERLLPEAVASYIAARGLYR